MSYSSNQEKNLTMPNAFYQLNNQEVKQKKIKDFLVEKRKEFDLLIQKIEDSHYFTEDIKDKLLSSSVKLALKDEFEKDATTQVFLEEYYAHFEQWGIKPYIPNQSTIKLNLSVSTNYNKQYLLKEQTELDKVILIPRKAFFVLIPNIEWNSDLFLDLHCTAVSCPLKTILDQKIDNIYMKNIIELAVEKSTTTPKQNPYLVCFVAEKLNYSSKGK